MFRSCALPLRGTVGAMNNRRWTKIILMLGLAILGILYIMQANEKVEIKAVETCKQHIQAREERVQDPFVEERVLATKATGGVSTQHNIEVSKAEERLRRLRQNMVDTCSRLGLNKTLTGEEIYSRNAYLEKSLFFSDKSKFLFCLIPKCATRSQATFLASVEGILSENEGAKASGYQLVTNLTTRKSTLEENGKRIEQYTKVAIAREPFSRLLSAFRDKLEKGGVSEYYKKIYHALKARHGNKTAQDKANFEDFVSYLTQPREAQTDPHWNYYYRLCAPCEMNYDYIVHMDTMEEDIEFLAGKFGIKNFSFPPSFNSFTDFEKVLGYYRNVSAKLVNDLYHRYRTDYEIFGFPPPPQF